MDGTLAGIFLLAGLTDMTINHCPTGCLVTEAAAPRIGIEAAGVVFQDDWIAREVMLSHDMGRRYGPFQPTFAVSLTSDGDLWAGAGGKWVNGDILPAAFFVEATLMPGLHRPADGPDLGGALQFRSSLGVGYAFDNGATLTAVIDHRSNADRRALNPGLETLSLRYAITLD